MANSFPGFPPEARKFLRSLKAHNKREWFLPRKSVFDEQVKAPMIELVLALGDELRGSGFDLVTAPEKAIYRIYRDVRFSKDKSPYKTHIAAVFTPRDLPKHAGAGLYFHIGPDEVLVGGGIYAPGPKELLAIRQMLAARHQELRAVLTDRGFRGLFGEMSGEKLKRVPKGFVSDHPAADLLVYKQFLAGANLPADIVETPKLYRQIAKHFQAIEPFLVLLNSALKARRARAFTAG